MKHYVIALSYWSDVEISQHTIKGIDELDALRHFIADWRGDTSAYQLTQDEIDDIFTEENYDYSLEEIGPIATPFEVIYREEGEVSSCFYDSYDELFIECARAIAFSDCVDDFEILCIKGEGCTFEYTGWAPGMSIAFMDALTGEVVWESAFPAWEH